MSLEKISTNKAFGGSQQRFSHQSSSLNCPMKFAIYLPPEASEENPVPVLYWLSGLTCTEENFIHKAGAQRAAAELNIAIVCPDTSPRGEGIADDPEGAYDLGLGAGFYLNATEAPWKDHYQMYDYVLKELPALIEAQFPVTAKRAICGHSMGGHGALTIALRNPERFSSVSAFSPISNPSNCPWGQKALTAYLGDDQSSWRQHDASELLNKAVVKLPILVDQGDNDEFLQRELKPGALIAAAQSSDYPLELRMQSGYDHSYYFIASFIEDHLRFHAKHLAG